LAEARSILLPFPASLLWACRQGHWELWEAAGTLVVTPRRMAKAI
jgi:hypothetical protein